MVEIKKIPDVQVTRIHGLTVPQADALRIAYAIRRGRTLAELADLALDTYGHLKEPPAPPVNAGEAKLILTLPVGRVLALKQFPGHDPVYNVAGVVRSSLRNLAQHLSEDPDAQPMATITIDDVWTRPRRRRARDLSKLLGSRMPGLGSPGVSGTAPAV